MNSDHPACVSVASGKEIRPVLDDIAAGRPIPVVMAKLEAALLVVHLRAAGGVIKAAAEAAGMPEPTFRKKMLKHGVKVRRVAVEIGIGDAA